MATATSLQNIRRQFLDENPAVGRWFDDYAAVVAGSVTVLFYADTNLPVEHLKGKIIYRPDAANASDFIRIAGNLTVASGLIAHTGASYTDVTLGTESLEIWNKRHIDPTDAFVRVANDALEYLFVECMIPLYHGPTDAAMELASTTNWTGANSTLAKQTTAAEVFQGLRSLSVTLTAASGYAESGLVNMGQGEAGMSFAIAKADTGTGIFRILDGSGNTIESVSFTQEHWLFMKKQFTLDATDEQARLRLLGTDNSDQIDWGPAWIVRQREPYFSLPSWLDERFKLKGVARAKFSQPGRESDTWLAGSMELERLEEGVHYTYGVRQADANPNMIFIEPGARYLLEEPLFLIVDAPYSAPYGVASLLSAESDTTTAPLHLLIAKITELWGSSYAADFPGMREKGKDLLAQRLHPRVTALPKRPRWGGVPKM